MTNFRQLLEQKTGQFNQINFQWGALRQTLYELQEQQGDLEKAQFIITEVALLTQNQLKYHVSEIATLALASVFDNPYELELDFVQRRNQTECDIYFVRDGERVDPLSSSGVGCVDVAAFALRIALWSLQKPRTRPILILDEPFRNVSFNYQGKVSAMVKSISERLGIQILMVTHSEELSVVADRVFKINQKRGKSHVESIT